MVKGKGKRGRGKREKGKGKRDWTARVAAASTRAVLID
jgi:hypothetical protein